MRTTASQKDISSEPVLPYGLIVLVVSVALLSAQVTATRLLGYRFYYHFVFLVISMAQLGLAAAGAWVYASRRVSASPGRLVRWLLGAAAVVLLTLVTYSWLSPSPTLAFAKVDVRAAPWYLILLASLLAALNFCGGMVLTLVFTRLKNRVGMLYASDLAGASMGALGSVGLMWKAGPIRAFLISGLMAAAAAAFLLAHEAWRNRGGSAMRARRTGERTGREGAAGERAAGRWSVTTLLILTALLLAALWRPDGLDPNVKFQRASGSVRSEWNHIARTDSLRPGRYVIDGDASTDLFERVMSDGASPEFLIAAEKPAVAIIGVGAGPELVGAVEAGASSVLAVDINPTIMRWNLEEDRALNDDLFHLPIVENVVDEGRHALRSSPRSFDLIMMYAIDTYTASSQGAYSLTENFLYTSEAIQDFHSKLTARGVLAIRRWLLFPPRETMRLFTTAHFALAKLGVRRPEDHLIVLAPVKDYRREDLHVWGYFFLSRSPFTPEQLAGLDRFVAARGWSYLYRPGGNEETEFSAFVRAADKQAFYDEYPYIVKPAQDSNPYFFQFTLPWSSRGTLPRHVEALYSESGSLLMAWLPAALVLAAILLGVPWLLSERTPAAGRSLRGPLAYFAALGAGFMAFELPAIQVMTLFLGHPTYALSVVLAALLASAGAGSFLMGRLPLPAIRPVLLVVITLALICAAALLPLAHALIYLPFWARLVTTLACLVVIGVPLGMPFVAGIRLIDESQRHLVAWAWAGNGAASVVGSSALMIVLVYASSTAAFLVAAGCYTTALLVLGKGVSVSPGAVRT